MAWSQLELEPAHIAYACVGIFSTLFSLVSLFVKERLYIGEATVASIAGLILGPHCLNWFNPISWGNSDYITLEICRIVLCIQIVAVAVELPKKYMMKHWLSVSIFLLPVMTFGWLIVGLFIWCLIPHFAFKDGLLVSACVTATDPVLAAAVVGKGKFAERVPGHLRNLLSAESGCNDGMAFPFIFLSLNLIIHAGNAREIVKDWFLLTILWECLFGCLLGAVIGYVLRKLVAFAEEHNLIDRESFLAIFVFIAFISAGVGSMLGVDDLLVSFAAGTAFGWNGAFAKKTEESHVSTVIDLLLNLSFFVYFGAIVPWPQFNNGAIGLDVWRLIVLAFVIIFLRRMPAVVALQPITPDVKTWREALFCGHFGPIGVGAIFASILARKDLEGHYTDEETPLYHLPDESFPHYQLLATIWPIVCFVVIVSIIVHGSSVAVLTLGKRLNRMAITMSFTTTMGQESEGGSGGWMQRLQKLDRANTSFSLQRVDTIAPGEDKENEKAPQEDVSPEGPETSGVKVRPAGGASRRKKKKKRSRQPGLLKKTLSRAATTENDERRQRPEAQVLQLGGRSQADSMEEDQKSSVESSPDVTTTNELKNSSSSSEHEKPRVPGQPQFVISPPTPAVEERHLDFLPTNTFKKTSGLSEYGKKPPTKEEKAPVPTVAYQDGDKVIIEDQYGEVMEILTLTRRDGGKKLPQFTPGLPQSPTRQSTDTASIHSLGSLERHLTQYSDASTGTEGGHHTEGELSDTDHLGLSPLQQKLSRSLSRRSFYKKDDPHKRKVYAHRVDNLIVIENEDGEIIRRYKVNKHTPDPSHPPQTGTSGQSKSRSRSSSLMGMVKSIVGKKSGDTPSPTSASPQTSASPNVDLEQGNLSRILLPHREVNEEDEHMDSRMEHKLEDKLANILEHKHESRSKTHAARKASPPPARRGADHYDDEEEEESDWSQDSEAEEETEVEKRRRLQALGKLPTSHNKDDEEEV
ncbi:Na(+)/H(+) antiporter [Candida viswanathii]|uniref:Na(+)/H(+) antiporter n=1 Tax=Candida viswanathii TaxID=5486 RepID=A0A367Y0X2_9ASCO|nr:Na(+)/H(+) antiporter [Candida viswanathii]